MRAKFHAPYFYAGENDENVRNLKSEIMSKNLVFPEKRDPEEVILGIESSFDESAACLINSYGEVKSKDVRYTQPEMSDTFNGGVDP